MSPDRFPNEPGALADALRTWVQQAADGHFARFFPDGRTPGFIAGAPTFYGTPSMIIHLLAGLKEMGAIAVNGQLLDEAMIAALEAVDPDAETWWSLYVADGLLAFGDSWEGHPLLTRMPAAQVDALRRAVDTTHVVDVAAEELKGKPNNYWIVVARCELMRQALGILEDETILDLAVRKSGEVLGATPRGFMDDDHLGRGRFDVYTTHGIHNTERFHHLLSSRTVARGATAMGELLDATARPDGLSVAWGRSGGAVSLATTAQLALLRLQRGESPDRSRDLGLVRHALAHLLDDWWADDAIAAQRRGTTHWYFGPGRLLETSLAMLANLCRMATALADLGKLDPGLRATVDPVVLFPPADVFLAFDERLRGVWRYRDDHLDFQVPLVSGYCSDYVAAPVSPGLFEQIIDSGKACGVPNVRVGKQTWLPLAPPVAVRHRPGSLSFVNPGFMHYVDWDWWKGEESLPGERRVDLRVEDGAIVGEETWTFDTTPDAVAFHFAESETPLAVEWSCPSPHATCIVVVDGMQQWRSHYHPIRRVYQVDFEPAREIRLGYRLRPVG